LSSAATRTVTARWAAATPPPPPAPWYMTRRWRPTRPSPTLWVCPPATPPAIPPAGSTSSVPPLPPAGSTPPT